MAIFCLRETLKPDQDNACGGMVKKSSFSFGSLNVFEIVFAVVAGVAIGVSYWGWTFVYEIFKPFLKVLGLQYLVAGHWVFVSVFIPFIIRKPFAGLVASAMAAYVESLLTHWGLITVLWGIVQGLGAELAFGLFRYQSFGKKQLALACLFSATFSYLLDYVMYSYGPMGLKLNLVQYTSFLVSALFFAGGLTLYLSRRLLAAQVLGQFAIGRSRR